MVQDLGFRFRRCSSYWLWAQSLLFFSLRSWYAVSHKQSQKCGRRPTPLNRDMCGLQGGPHYESYKP